MKEQTFTVQIMSENCPHIDDYMIKSIVSDWVRRVYSDYKTFTKVKEI